VKGEVGPRKGPQVLRVEQVGKVLLRNENFARLIFLVVLIATFGVATGGVTSSSRGIQNILIQISTTGIAAIGQAFVILSGGIDLSVSGIGVLSSIIGALCMTSATYQNILGQVLPFPAAIVLMLLVSTVLGSINGLIISRLRIPALVVTFGIWQVTYGIGLLTSGGRTVANLPDNFRVDYSFSSVNML
jgi:ribose/xylose/arabinose/galactoside ABC-type transport system permease subunit